MLASSRDQLARQPLVRGRQQPPPWPCRAAVSAGAAAGRRQQRLADWRGRVAVAASTTTTATAATTTTTTTIPPPPPPPTTQQQQQPLLEVLGPPDGWDFRADVTPDTRAVVAQAYPELLDLVDRGVLIAWVRGSPRASPAMAAALRGEVAPPADAAPEPELVLVLGVAHASRRSAADVDRVIRAVRPDNVVVELCRSRSSLLRGAAGGEEGEGVAQGESNSDKNNSNTNNPVPLGGASSFAGVMARSLRLGGQAGLVLQLVLGWRAKQAMAMGAGGGASSPSSPASSPSPRVGAEFAAAAAAADAVGAQLVLGDRPIEVTLARAWAACGGLAAKASLLRDLLLVPMPSAAALAAAALQGSDDDDEDDEDSKNRRALVTVSAAAAARFNGASSSADGPLIDAAERLRTDDDAVSAALAALTKARPALASPLVHERDAYLAWSLRRSKAVRGSSVVVGVVGAAHMRGVAFCLRHGARYKRRRSGSEDDNGGGAGAGAAAAAGDEAAPLSFADLARTGPRVTGGERATRAIVDVAIGVAAWAAWQALFP